MMLMLKMIYVTVVEASWSPLGDPLHFSSTTHVELALYLSVHTHALLSIQDSIYFAIKKSFHLQNFIQLSRGSSLFILEFVILFFFFRENRYENIQSGSKFMIYVNLKIPL